MRTIPPDFFKPFEATYRRGRFVEEVNVTLELEGRVACHIKIFYGRPPYYSPWAEVFNLAPWFIGSRWERQLYCVLSEYMDPGDILYVEYVDDFETFAALRRGTPPAETRLGRLLVECGLDVVRDWYYPEGWLEGGMKLQAVKRLSSSAAGGLFTQP